MKKPLQSNRGFFTLFICIVILLGGGVWNAFISERSVGESIEKLDNDKQRITDLRALVSAIKELESGQRGFVITGDNSYLKPFERGRTEVSQIQTSLEPWLSDDPKYSKTWKEVIGLINQKIVTLEEVSDIRKENGFEAAVTAVTSETGKALMDEIEKKIYQILEEVELEAANSNAKAKTSLKRNVLAISFLSLVTVAMSFGGIYLLLNSMRTKSEAEKLELEKAQAERADREKSRFLASMSHEIRTPLNAMLGFGELLDDVVEGDRAKKYVSAIRSSGEGLLNLINDILDLSKIEAGALELDPEPVVVRQFADSVKLIFSQKAMESGLDLSVSVNSDVPDFLVFDPLRVRQILTNLVGNAIKFTEAGSVKVEFAIEPIKEEEDLVDFLISVTDTGRGIPRKKFSQIFKPFKQVESEDEARGGTGLGLSICKRLSDLMDGKITVESEWGKGSTFTLRLDNTELATSAGRSTEELEGLGTNLNVFAPATILFVDDNRFNRELVSGYLEGSHHTVHFATNGKEGVDQCVRTKPDIVLMDIRMPVMNGKEAFKAIRKMEEFEDLPILAVTASSLLHDELKLRKEFDGYLRKPFSRAHLADALDPFLPRVGKMVDDENKKQPVIDVEEDIDQEELEKLVQQLKEWQNERVPNLSAAMVLGEISDFADDLKSAGEKYHCDVIREFASDLKSRSESFELSAVESMLEHYAEIVEKLDSKLLPDT